MSNRPRSPALASDGADSDIYAESPRSPEPALTSPRLLTPGKRKAENDLVPLNDKKQKRENVLSKYKEDLRLNKRWQTWQLVFCLLSPRTLCNLMTVSKDFLSCLTITDDKLEAPELQDYRLFSGNSVWAASRKVHFPDLPDPPPDCSEQKLWQLLLGKLCTVCENLGATASGNNPSASIVWPFAARLCLNCVVDTTQDEHDLLMSDASHLRPYLPWAFVNSRNALVTTMDVSERVVPVSELKKVYYRPEIERLTPILAEASGNALKDLLNERQKHKIDRMASARQWETWQRGEGIETVNTRVQQSVERQLHLSPTAILHRQPVLATPPLHHPVPGSWLAMNGSERLRNMSASTTSTSARNQKDVQEGKAAREAGIVSRCQNLLPPIRPEVLPYMAGFTTSMRESHALRDDEWQALRPQLVQELPDAEKRYIEVHGDLTSSRPSEEPRSAKDTSKDPDNQGWEDSQSAIRSHLASYAQQDIAQLWQSGAAVNQHNVADFASQVLRKTRDRWQSNHETHGSVQDHEPRGSKDYAVSAGPLTLDALKWVYNDQIKPIAEKFTKELFLCNGCNDPRMFTLEGCIQHYSSRHTNEMSHGKSGISWQTALWQQKSPFAADPSQKLVQRKADSSNTNQNLPTRGGRPQYGGHEMTDASNSHTRQFTTPQQPIHQSTPYGPPPPPQMPHYQNQYGMHPSQYYAMVPSPAPPTPFSNGGWSRPGSAHPGSTHTWYPPPPPPPPPLVYSPPVHDGRYPPPSPMQGPPYPYGAPAPVAMQHGYMPVMHPPVQPPVQPPQPGLYEIQLNWLAPVLLDVYSSLSSLRNMIPSVSIFCAIQRSASLFSSEFRNELNFELFTRCVMTHPSLHQLKNAVNLGCKACRDAEEADRKQGASFRIYPFHELLSHFRNVHYDRNRIPEAMLPDWKTELLELPTQNILRPLMNDSAPDDQQRIILHESLRGLLDSHVGDDPMQYDPQHPQISSAEHSRSRRRNVDPSPHRSRDSSDHAAYEGNYRVVQFEDGPYRLVPSERGRRRDERYEERRETRYYERTPHQPPPRESRRMSQSHHQRPAIKQEPSDDAIYQTRSRHGRGGPRR